MMHSGPHHLATTQGMVVASVLVLVSLIMLAFLAHICGGRR